jgi:hypothetical protein
VTRADINSTSNRHLTFNNIAKLLLRIEISQFDGFWTDGRDLFECWPACRRHATTGKHALKVAARIKK